MSPGRVWGGALREGGERVGRGGGWRTSSSRMGDTRESGVGISALSFGTVERRSELYGLRQVIVMANVEVSDTEWSDG